MAWVTAVIWVQSLAAELVMGIAKKKKKKPEAGQLILELFFGQIILDLRYEVYIESEGLVNQL